MLVKLTPGVNTTKLPSCMHIFRFLNVKLGHFLKIALSSKILNLNSKNWKKYKQSLVGLTPRVHFINILRAAFTHIDPESAKKSVNWTVIFAPLGSAHVKAARRMLMKLTPGLVTKWCILLTFIYRRPSLYAVFLSANLRICD